MLKRLTIAWLWLGLLGAAPMATGCHHKTRVVERSETIQESEPQMIAPGKEKVE